MRCHTHSYLPVVQCYLLLTHTHMFNGPLSGNTRVSQYQKGKTNLDFTEVRDSEWQWHQLGHIQVCTLLQTDNHPSTPPLSFLQAACPSCCPTNSVKVLKAWRRVTSFLTCTKSCCLVTQTKQQDLVTQTPLVGSGAV